MQHPIRITSRDFALTAASEAPIRKRVDRLEGYFDRITSCHVVLSAPTVHHHQKGGPFEVSIVRTFRAASWRKKHTVGS